MMELIVTVPKCVLALLMANRSGDLHVTDGDMPERAGSGWHGVNNDYLWTSATDDVFKDCVIPATI